MPLFDLKCKKCGYQCRRLLKPSEALTQVCECGNPLIRNGRGPSTQVLESLDNGSMPRRVERLRDAERLYRERAAGGDALAGRSLNNVEEIKREHRRND